MSVNIQPNAASIITTTNTTNPYYPTTNTPSSDGSVSSCSDNSAFSVTSGFSTATSNSTSSFRSVCTPSQPSPNIIKAFKLGSAASIPNTAAITTTTTTTTTTAAAAAAATHKKVLKISIPTTAEMISAPKQLLPSPGLSPSPKRSHLGKRRHSADEVMTLSLPPNRRGVVNGNASAAPDKPAPSPPLAALRFDFSDDSFRRDSTGRVHIEVVPTPKVAAEDMMELYPSENEDDRQLKETEDEMKGEEDEANNIGNYFDRYPTAGSPLYELGEAVEPYELHPSHPFHSLEKELMCKICHGLMLAPHGLSCGHTFCGICLALWIDGAKTKCYECHAHIVPTQRPMFPNFKLDSTVEHVAKMILDESELEVRRARKIEWLRYSYTRMPGLGPYSALLREQYAMLLRGIQDASVDSPKTEGTSSAHGPQVRSKPIPIPKGTTPRST